MSEWQPIETCPDDGFFLVHEDGMIRTMWRYQGKWEVPDFPILIDRAGNHLVPREVQELRGETLAVSGGIRAPTHWMELPEPPNG